MAPSIRPEQDPLFAEYERKKKQQQQDPLTAEYEASKGQLNALASGQPVEGEPAHGKPASFIAGLGSGMTFGFADEILAGMEALDKSIPYREALESVRDKLGGIREANPGTAFAGELVGGMALPFGAATKAVTVPGKIAAGARVGAAGGAVAGAGNAEGGFTDRAAGALLGGAVGGVTGGVAGAAVPAVTTLGRGLLDVSGLRPRSGVPGTATAAPRMGAIGDIAEKVAPRSSGERGADKLLEALEQDNPQFSLDDFKAIIASRQLRPKPETVMELGGENVKGLGETVATIPGKSKEQIERALTTRIGEPLAEGTKGSYARIRADIESAFNLSGGSTLEAADEIVARRAEAARPLYQKAFEGGAVADEKLAELLKRPSVQRAIGYARELAQEKGDDIALPDAGAPIDIRTLHHIKLALDDALHLGKRALPSSVTESSTGPTKLRAIAETRAEVKRILNTNEAYKQASAIWAGESALKDALEEGADVVSRKQVSGEDIRRAMADLTDGEKAMYRQGAVNALLNATGDVGDGRNIVQKLAGNPNSREKLRAMVDSDEAFETFMNDLEREGAMYATRNKVIRGSQTASRLAGQEFLADIPKDAADPKWFSPSFLANKAIDMGRRRQIKTMAESLGDYLTAGTPESPMSLDILAMELAKAAQRRAAQSGRQVQGAGVAGRTAGGASQRRDR